MIFPAIYLLFKELWKLPCLSLIKLDGIWGWIIGLMINSTWEYHWYIIYTLWLFNIAMENCTFIDGLPIKNGDFPWLCEITRWYIYIYTGMCVCIFNCISVRFPKMGTSKSSNNGMIMLTPVGWCLFWELYYPILCGLSQSVKWAMGIPINHPV